MRTAKIVLPDDPTNLQSMAIVRNVHRTQSSALWAEWCVKIWLLMISNFIAQHLQLAARPALKTQSSTLTSPAVQRAAFSTIHSTTFSTSAVKVRVGLRTATKSAIAQGTPLLTPSLDRYQSIYASTSANMSLLPIQVALRQFGEPMPIVSAMHSLFSLLIDELRHLLASSPSPSPSQLAGFATDGSYMYGNYSVVMSNLMQQQIFILTRSDYYAQFLQLNQDMVQYIQTLQNSTNSSDQINYSSMIQSMNELAKESALAIQDYQLHSYNFTVAIVGKSYGISPDEGTYLGLRFGDNDHVGVVSSPQSFRIIQGVLQTSESRNTVYTLIGYSGHDYYNPTVNLDGLLAHKSGSTLPTYSETWSIVNDTLTSTQSGSVATTYMCSFPPAPIVFKATANGPSDLDDPDGGCKPVTLSITRV